MNSTAYDSYESRMHAKAIHGNNNSNNNKYKTIRRGEEEEENNKLKPINSHLM